jgi:hypothetical protein
MARNTNNYSRDRDTKENLNADDKYSVTGESEFSRESTIPYDQDEVLSERHYNFGSHEEIGRKRVRTRELPPEESMQQGHRGRDPKGYRRSDEVIREDVSEALYRSSEVDASEIEVFVSSGHVTLKGSIPSRDQKKLAELTIENLAGIEDVFNELKIKLDMKSIPGKYGLTDNITGMN